ncbi:MAG: glycosyltransferase family 2 protein [Pseudomonadota bacterium]
MISLLLVALWIGTICVSIPALFLSLEIIRGVQRLSSKNDPAPVLDGRATDLSGLRVLIPAHNEAGQIKALLGDLSPQIPLSQVLVVADNCDDETAIVAGTTGAMVAVRNDPQKRGKAYALAHGRAVLSADENVPQHVLFIDADCRVAPGTVAALMVATCTTGRPVQAEYKMLPFTDDKEAIPGQSLSAFAFFVMNSLRQRGLATLGAPARINGTGMMIPWFSVQRLDLDHANLAEDLEMGLEFALEGHPTLFVPEGEVASVLPGAANQEVTQRQRWEKGSRDAQQRYAMRLLGAGMRGRRPLLYALLDLWVPPVLKLIFFFGSASILSVVALTFGVSGPFFILFCVGLILGISLLRGAAAYNEDAIAPLSLRDLKAFLALKLKVTQAGEAKEWVRTAREKD